jgi:hypothetical protein
MTCAYLAMFLTSLYERTKASSSSKYTRCRCRMQRIQQVNCVVGKTCMLNTSLMNQNEQTSSLSAVCALLPRRLNVPIRLPVLIDCPTDSMRMGFVPKSICREQ